MKRAVRLLKVLGILILVLIALILSPFGYFMRWVRDLAEKDLDFKEAHHETLNHPVRKP